ncbi:MAG: Ig-like domain-containing protein [Proteobacteria bacterium]|nr:Ig-like domain-containing protein [Pseudomonadota bacterium]
MRLRFLALALMLPALAGCPNDVEPIALRPTGPWTAADYDLQVTSSHTAATTGEPVTFTVALIDPYGDDVASAYDIRTEVSPALGVIAEGDGVYRFTAFDTFTYFASTDVLGTTLVGSASVDVTAGPALNIQVQAEPPIVEAGQPVTLTAVITDEFGNPTTGTVEWSSSPAASISGNELVAVNAGSYTITGTLAGGGSDDDGVVVEPGPPVSLDISLSSYDVEKGQGVIVTSVVLDEYGNQSDHPVELGADPVTGVEAWDDFVRFHNEGIFTVNGTIPEYSLYDEDGPVLVDSSGPQIRVTTPTRGAEIPSADGPTVSVTGSVSDPWTGVTSVLINGESATLAAGGLFSFEMTPEQGLNELTVVATDGDNNVSDHFQTFLWGEFNPIGDPQEDGILARLNEGAIDVLEQLIEDEVESGSLSAGLLGNVYTSPSYCLDLWVVEICGQFLLNVSAVDIGDLEMDLDPNGPTGGFPNGYLGFSMDLIGSGGDPGISVTLEPTGVFSACVVILGCYSTSVSFDAVVGVDEIYLDTDVGLDVDSNNDIQVTLANTDASLSGIFVDLSDIGLIGDILGDVSTFLLGLFEPIFNAILPPLIEAALPDVLESAFADLEIVQEIDLLGATLEIAALPQNIEIDDDGMTIALESSAAAEPLPGAPPTLGSWRRSDYDIPTYGAGPDFAISLGDNFTNQLMHAVWQAGVIDFSMESDELGLDLSSLGDILPLTTIEFETVPLLPPVVGPGPSGLLELGLGDMLVNVYGDPGGTYGLMMQLAVTLTAEASLDFDPDGNIEFNLEPPVIIMDFVTSDWPELNGEVTENLMDAVVELIIPEVTGALDELGGIPLPELGGFSLESPAMYREPDPVYFITAEGGLAIAP